MVQTLYCLSNFDSRNRTAICDLPKKRKGRQVSPDRRRIKHRKINEDILDTNKLCNVFQIRNDVFVEKTKARPSQRSDKADHVSDGALCGQPPLKKVPVRILRGLKFNKNLGAKKDVPDCPERQGKGYLQTCPPLDPTSLSVTGEIELNSSASPLPPDSQNTTDLPKPRKRQTSLDTPRKKHRGINEATTDASKLGDCNNLDSPAHCFRSVASSTSESTSESTRIELDETLVSLPSNAPVPKIHDPQRDVEAHPALGQNVDMTRKQETPITSCIPFFPAQSSYAVSGLQETVEGIRHDHVQSMLNRGMEEEVNLSEDWLGTQELEEDFILDCEDPAATEMEDRPINIFPTHKPPLCVNPPIWAQVCDNTLRYNKLSAEPFFLVPPRSL